jgi:hypothetical protein
MPVNSVPEASPKKNRRSPKRKVAPDISSGLREQVTQAARKIRAAHEAELADVLKADGASRLFRSIIHPNGKPVGSPAGKPQGLGIGVEALAGDLGGLLLDAISKGTGLLEGSLTALTQAWMDTVIGPAPAKPSPRNKSQAHSTATSQMPGATVDAAMPASQPADVPSSREEVMFHGIFRRFMPMLLTALSQGADGYGLANTVIALFGRPTYNQISGLGKDKIMQLIKADPDLWAQVAPREAEFTKFLDEFTRYDAHASEQNS